MKTIFSTIALVFILSVQAMAQQIEMADEMRGSGKIYVVVAVLALIFIGIVAYLFSIDRKLKTLEDKK